MKKTIKNFITPALDQKVWQIRHRIGSALKFEIGKQIDQELGEYHFWIDCCHWWLQQGKNDDFKDIVNSESSKKNITSKIDILNDKKLLHIEYNEELAATIFDFEEGLFLRIAPYGGNKITDQWYLFTPEKTLTIKSDGTIFIKDSE